MNLRTVQLASRYYYTYFPPEQSEFVELVRRYTPEEKEPFYHQFEKNLEEIIKLAEERGVTVVIGTVAYCYLLPPLLPPLETVGFDFPGQIEQASDDMLAQWYEKDPHHAWILYALGKRAALRGDGTTAKPLLEDAFLYDSRPHRADSRINAIIRDVATRHAIPLADVHGAIGAVAPLGIPGSELFNDHCHLNETGRDILQEVFAAAIAQRLQQKGAQANTP